MMKAFDRVEWQFVEDTLTTLGFHPQWRAWIMQCITTVSFGVLINGKKYGSFLPSRGLRQGDPLSPFLFILCTEILITRLNRSDSANTLHGLEVAAAAPPISHLFFADDSVFFTSAEEEQISTLRLILNQYAEASGQRVNFDKSSIVFGSKMSEINRLRVKTITGINQEGGQGIYLGMPETFLGSKTSTLSFLERRVKDRIGSWKNKFLSQGGKEILLKSVALAIPAYAMSCFLLPKGLINKITQDFAQFWWKNQQTGKGIHWHTWESLGKRKESGGLNFRNLQGFNLALLGKQFWRISVHPQTLLARTLKAKYFPRDTSILTARLGARPSYGWRSVLASRDLMKMGLKKEFGSGDQIDLWQDPWILDTQPRAPRSFLSDPESLPTIDMLKDRHSDEWSLTCLQRFFERSEINLITQIKPGGADSQCSFSWIHTPSGAYSVKSGYRLWCNYLAPKEIQGPEQKPSYSQIFSAIWKLQVSNKLKNFLWRCLSKSVPVGIELYKKRIISDPSCILCGHAVEDINHMLFECHFARLVWSLSPYGNLFYPQASRSLYVNLWECISLPSSLPAVHDDTCLWPWIIWRLWKTRNDLGFQNRPPDAVLLFEKAKVDACEWAESNKVQVPPQQPTLVISRVTLRWAPPSQNFLKCNVDAAWHDENEVCGTAWILRDHSGHVKLFGRKTFPKLLSSLEAEAAALVWAVSCMWNMSYERIIFESDSLSLIQAVEQPTLWPRLSTFTSEIKGILTRRPWQVRFTHVGRERNKAADSLAKHALLFSPYCGYIDNNIPLWLRPFLAL